jgi:hypothetical protein
MTAGTPVTEPGQPYIIQLTVAVDADSATAAMGALLYVFEEGEKAL